MAHQALRCIAASCALMMLAAASAAAQHSNSGVGIGPSQQLSRPLPHDLESPAPSVEHLFGGQGSSRRAKPPRRFGPPAPEQQPSAPLRP